MKFLSCKRHLTLLVTLTCLPFSVLANTPHQLTIINHYDKPLNFLMTINPQNLPDLNSQFTLNTNASVTTQVINSGGTYLHVDDNASCNHDRDVAQAFWSVSVENDTVQVHGYIGKGIAYSWNTDKVVFCTPAEFKQRHGCL